MIKSFRATKHSETLPNIWKEQTYKFVLAIIPPMLLVSLEWKQLFLEAVYPHYIQHKNKNIYRYIKKWTVKIYICGKGFNLTLQKKKNHEKVHWGRLPVNATNSYFTHLYCPVSHNFPFYLALRSLWTSGATKRKSARVKRSFSENWHAIISQV